MNRNTFFLGIILASIVSALVATFAVTSIVTVEKSDGKSISEKQSQVRFTNFSDSSLTIPKGINFVYAAEKAVLGVVHIRAMYSNGESGVNPLEGFFRNPAQSSGSGVILTSDGYIVTNNHVIEDATEIEVVLNDNRSYMAKLIGTDPTTDLALLKVNAQNLDYIEYGNSDNIRFGEWVLAVGNPFDLNSTVTAGIISAKARNIGILRDKNNLQIEAFIQTDAAVNPGNSGGALVNLKGKLIGINTAIATPTGNYAGYSFAVPVSLVKKVMDDLLEYGEVQRGLLGIRIGDVNAQLAEMQDLSVVNGVFVSRVNENSAAEEAGILEGDVIVAINNTPVNNVSELQEMVARNRPGDQIEVTYMRGDQKVSVDAVLKDFEGNTALERKVFSDEIEGAKFEELNLDELETYAINNGIQLVKIEEGKWKEAGIKQGFIIKSIDKLKVNNLADLHNILSSKSGGILVEGVYPNGDKGVYGMDW